MSADGRYIAFATDASNLVPGDTNGKVDVFVHDMVTAATARVSVAADGTQGNDVSYLPFVSADGRYVSFQSNVSNLVPDDTNGSSDIFLTPNPLFGQNQAPVLTPIGNKSVDEGQTLSFTVSATDPDGDALTYSASNLPSGSTFDPATHTFSWTPTYGQAGNYTNVEFTVTDNGTPMQLALEDITISVGHVNRPPVFAPVGAQQASTTIPLSFSVSATDPDNDAVTLSAANVPQGAAFNPSTGTFSWTPAYNQAGIYTVTFTATDNGTPTIATSSLDVVISVSVSSPIVLTQNLIDIVTTSNLPTSQVNSYLFNLRKAIIFINKGSGQGHPAINQLNQFIQQVNQDFSQGKLTQAQRDAFVGQAQAIINAL